MNSKKSYIKINLAQELKDDFKVVCAAEGITITSSIISYMREKVENNRAIINEVKKMKDSQE